MFNIYKKSIKVTYHVLAAIAILLAIIVFIFFATKNTFYNSNYQFETTNFLYDITDSTLSDTKAVRSLFISYNTNSKGLIIRTILAESVTSEEYRIPARLFNFPVNDAWVTNVLPSLLEGKCVVVNEQDQILKQGIIYVCPIILDNILHTLGVVLEERENPEDIFNILKTNLTSVRENV